MRNSSSSCRFAFTTNSSTQCLINVTGHLHTLFDRGYLTVTPEYAVEVSQRIKEEFNNGKEYYAMHGTRLAVPGATAFRPDPELLKWHNESIFVA